MIKINLSTAKKSLDVSDIGGFDFTRIKIKPLLLVILIIYIPDFFLSPMWENERQEVMQENEARRAVLAGIKSELAKSQEHEKQIKELQAQEEALSKKLVAVKQAILEKRNPAPILLYISKNIPPELWIKELTISAEQMVIKGEALDYTSLGTFVNSLRASVFIKDSNIVSTNSIVRPVDNRRIESFEVNFSIERFNQ